MTVHGGGKRCRDIMHLVVYIRTGPYCGVYCKVTLKSCMEYIQAGYGLFLWIGGAEKLPQAGLVNLLYASRPIKSLNTTTSTPYAQTRSEECSNLVPKVAECSLFNSSADGFVHSPVWPSHLNLFLGVLVCKGHIINYGSRGSTESVGGSLNSETLFWGDHSIPGPIYGGINKSSSWRDHKIDLMEDHGVKIFAATLHALLFV